MERTNRLAYLGHSWLHLAGITRDVPRRVTADLKQKQKGIEKGQFSGLENPTTPGSETVGNKIEKMSDCHED